VPLVGWEVVCVVTEWVLQLSRNQVDAAHADYGQERKEGRAQRVARPNTHHERGEENVDAEQYNGDLSVWKRERDGHDLERRLKVHHALPHLLEDSGEDRRRHGQYTSFHVLQDQELDPLVHNVGSPLVLLLDNDLQVALAECVKVDDRKALVLHAGNGAERRSVEQAE